MSKLIRIATRQSPLALWQANFVKSLLFINHPELQIELIKIVTKGDKFLEKPLVEIGGKGLFLKELEEALLAGTADIAVHSMKDVPTSQPDGLVISTILNREDPRDVLISPHHHSIETLPKNAKVGTASLRRAAQIKRLRPDLQTLPCRGNVQTRLDKCFSGEFDAIILAYSGLIRLEKQSVVTRILSFNESLPAVGQGAIGIECAENNSALFNLLKPLHCQTTAACLTAERTMNHALGGSCHTPIAGHATFNDETLTLSGLVLSEDGQTSVSASASDSLDNASLLGKEIAHQLIEAGAKELLKNFPHA